MNITTSLSTILLLVVPIFALLLLLSFYYPRHKRLDSIIRGINSDGQLSQQDIGYLSRDNLTQGFLSVQNRQPGKILYDIEGIRLVFFKPTTQQPVILPFQRRGIEISLIDTGGSISILPRLIRLFDQEQNKSAYFCAQKFFNQPDNKQTKALFESLQEQGYRVTDLPLRGLSAGFKLAWVGLGMIVVIALMGIIIGGLTGFAEVAPNQLAVSPDHHVFAASETMLYHFDQHDRLVKQWSMATLGINSGITHLQAIDEHHLWLGDWQDGSIKQCDLQQQQCQRLPAFNAQPDTFRRAFKFVADPQHEVFYAADTARHRLLTLDQQGNLLASTRGGGAIPVCFPNNWVIGQDGFLYLADTNNFRVVAWPIDTARTVDLTGKPEKDIAMIIDPKPSVSCAAQDNAQGKGNAWLSRNIEYEKDGIAYKLNVARPGRVWPTSFFEDSHSNWWILLGDHNLRRSDLLKFDKDWQNPKRIDLPDYTDIADIAVLPDRVLAIDPSVSAILQISLEGKRITRYGDSVFYEQMQELKRAKEFGLTIYQISIPGFVIMIMALIVLLVLQMRSCISQIIKADGLPGKGI